MVIYHSTVRKQITFNKFGVSKESNETQIVAPWKINMEPTNHPFRKENDLPNLHDNVPC